MTIDARARAGIVALLAIAVLACLAPWLAPNRDDEQFDRAYAPPMRIHMHDATGWHAPFVYLQVIGDRTMRAYRDDTTRGVPLEWLSDGRFVSIPRDAGPLLLLGADSLGRDVFSRLVIGGRLSLGVAILGTIGALVFGTLIGGWAGSLGGRTDRLLMLAADFIVVLPGAYLVLVLRGVLPLVLETGTIFALLVGLFVFAAWPHVARGVRAIIAVERTQDYADASRASGAGPIRFMWQLLPAASGFLAIEAVLLVPALLVAEASVSFLGLGFSIDRASWGTMLQDTSNVAMMADTPWLLAPAGAIFLVVFSLHLAGGSRSESALFASIRGPISSRS